MKSILTLLIFVILGVASCKEKERAIKKYKMQIDNQESFTVYAVDDSAAYQQAVGIFETLKNNDSSTPDTAKGFELKDQDGKIVKMNFVVEVVD